MVFLYFSLLVALLFSFHSTTPVFSLFFSSNPPYFPVSVTKNNLHIQFHCVLLFLLLLWKKKNAKKQNKMVDCVWPGINVSLDNLQHANNNLHVIGCIHTQNGTTFGLLLSLYCSFSFRFFTSVRHFDLSLFFKKTLFGHFLSCTICLLLLPLVFFQTLLFC